MDINEDCWKSYDDVHDDSYEDEYKETTEYMISGGDEEYLSYYSNGHIVTKVTLKAICRTKPTLRQDAER